MNGPWGDERVRWEMKGPGLISGSRMDQALCSSGALCERAGGDPPSRDRDVDGSGGI